MRWQRYIFCAEYKEKSYFCTVKQAPTSTPENWPPARAGVCVFLNTFFQKTPSVDCLYTPMCQSVSSPPHPFTFTGKERDEETGYGYFGARYMDHELMTMWLSVDPMADKYPGISPYAYCAWNPVRLVDPDGRDWYDVDKSGHITRNEKKSEQYKDNDILHSTSTGETSKLYRKGTIAKVYNNITLNNKSGQLVSFGDASTREDHLSIFEFCANNTDVEFSLMQFEVEPSNPYTCMTTSHNLMSDDGRSSDDYGSEVAKANSKTLISHSSFFFILSIIC